MKSKNTAIDVLQVSRGEVSFTILGTSPLICNAMSAKVRQELLLPSPKKNAAAKAANLKHEPLVEFAASMYRARDPESPTEIVMPATAFKSALAAAALDIPGAQKTQIARLTYVLGDQVSIYGVPELFMAVTRMADIKRTPDVRSRAILPRWAAQITVQFIEPLLKAPAVFNLMAAAGMMQGVGDYRIEKGKGNYGAFTLVPDDDPEFLEIVKAGGRDAQLAAIEAPACYDSETEELLSWFNVEAKRRGFKVVGE